MAKVKAYVEFCLINIFLTLIPTFKQFAKLSPYS